jgi:hypothetical protein
MEYTDREKLILDFLKDNNEWVIDMIQNNITRTEELQEIVKSVIALRKIVNYEARAELENINTALQKLITKEIQELKEFTKYCDEEEKKDREVA